MLKSIKKNVKKVLALVLAFACAFTMFAGAAFTDESDFAVDTNVVNTLVGLGVIDGYDDGSFRPEATVTRAEMAKMIYVIRTGKSDASAYNNDATTFTDISDHWARGYIKYCQSLGIIAGKSTTKFDPDATVTTQEAAKMLLVTLGYNAEKAGLEGSGWGAKTTALADENGLLKDVNCGTTQGMPRQYAAQLMYNTIFAPTVVLRDGEYTNMNLLGTEKNPTVGVKYMDLKEYRGVMTDVGYNDAKSEYIYTVKGEGTESFSAEADYTNMYAMKVNVLYKTVNGKTTVYGIYEYESDVLAEDVIGNIEDLTSIKEGTTDKVKIDGTEYKLNDDITGYYFLDGEIADTDEVVAMDGYKAFDFKAIDNNEDNKIDTIVVYPVTVEKVTFINSTKFTTDKTFTSTKELEDVHAYEGMAKDDYVVVTAAANTADSTPVLEKATMVTGKINGTKSGSIMIDGTWYEEATSGLFSGHNNGSTVEMAVIGTIAFSCETTSDSVATSDVVYVEQAAVESTSTGLDQGDKLMAKIVKADGTIVKAEVSMADDKEVVDNDADDVTADQIKADAAVSVINNKLCSFSMDGEKFELTVLDGDNLAGYKKYASGSQAYDKDDATLGGFDIADDSVIFVKAGDEDDTKVITGKTLKTWSDKSFTNTNILTLESSSKFQTVAVASVQIGTMPASGDTVYGYVVADPYTTKVDGTTYANYSIWTADGLKDYIVKESSPSADKEDLVAFNLKSDNEIEFAALSTTTGAVLASTDSRVQIKTADDKDTYKITDDTVIVYIDTEEVEGSEGGSIAIAPDADESNYCANVKFTANEDNELEVIYVAVNGQFGSEKIAH